MNHPISKKAAKALILADLRDTFQDDEDVSEEEILRWTKEYLEEGEYELPGLSIVRLNGKWYLSEPTPEEIEEQAEIRRIMKDLESTLLQGRKEAWHSLVAE